MTRSRLLLGVSGLASRLPAAALDVARGLGARLFRAAVVVAVVGYALWLELWSQVIRRGGRLAWKLAK